ncbi:NAD(P)-dependent oxidoreductase [Gynuella sunshinyii]|uniref:3-hydroxyisobutyrate dehydrogenase and related beta-hydroxyacid dehydrogenase n=1 Tax=Gynuella sunshinyii YC6258 TaxID=1445510 RepID=A0A0C5VN34_9GAMM|nr:DUF1932 domain-containing protein [Gynuella sunshinyii]AJQ96132.1 3-hydroxyisobutyrate dehydrogenase and related beta-hydroxyacid dehydrogenase [Gynuella sunshinyii YC6258]
MSVLTEKKLVFLGVGEAAGAFSRSMNIAELAQMSGFDIKSISDDEQTRTAKQQDFQEYGIQQCQSLEEALTDADWIISVVTADQAQAAARSAVPYLQPGVFFFDCNSCSPNTKKNSAGMIAEQGACYVDVAVMAPVYPLRNKTPLLLSGPYATEGTEIFSALGLNPKVVEGEIGASSSIKMIRSIMVKGMEALTAECVLAGRLAGVDERVLESLDLSYPGFDWKNKAAYNLERMTQHGIRRAAEMQEVDLFLSELGFTESMSANTAKLQQKIGQLRLRNTETDYRKMADLILAKLFN